MSSEEDDGSLLWSGGDVKVEVSVSVSVSDASDGSACDLEGCENVGEEAVTAPIDGFLEGSADYSESLELGAGIVEDDGTEVCQETEGGSSDEYWDNVEEFVTGVGDETDWMDEPMVSDSFLDFAEDCDLRESLGDVEELGGSERVERDHVPGNLGGDGSVAVRSSNAGNNSNVDEGFDYAERSGINGTEEGRSSGGSSGFEDDIDLEHDSPISIGASWDIVDPLRVFFNGDAIQRGFEDFDWDASDGSAFDLEGCETVAEEEYWEEETAVAAPFNGFLEGSADYSESLELGAGIVEDDGTEVCQETEGGSSDEYWDNVEEFVTGVGEETDWMDEPMVSDSFLDFAEDCDLRESLGDVEELGGSERVERDHMPGNLGGDGSVAVRSSNAGDNSNVDEGFDYAERSGINGMEEGRNSGGSSGFEDDNDLEHDSPISVGASWDIVDPLRVVFNGDAIRRGLEDFDWEVSLEDQIIRFQSGTRWRRDASSAAAKDVVESLPVTEVKEGMFEQGSDSDGGCAVCKNNVQVGERVRRLPCLHYFHDECIMPWLEIRNTCPLCRHELPTEEVGREGFQWRRVDPSPDQL